MPDARDVVPDIQHAPSCPQPAHFTCPLSFHEPGALSCILFMPFPMVWSCSLQHRPLLALTALCSAFSCSAPCSCSLSSPFRRVHGKTNGFSLFGLRGWQGLRAMSLNLTIVAEIGWEDGRKRVPSLPKTLPSNGSCLVMVDPIPQPPAPSLPLPTPASAPGEGLSPLPHTTSQRGSEMKVCFIPVLKQGTGRCQLLSDHGQSKTFMSSSSAPHPLSLSPTSPTHPRTSHLPSPHHRIPPQARSHASPTGLALRPPLQPPRHPFPGELIFPPRTHRPMSPPGLSCS